MLNEPIYTRRRFGVAAMGAGAGAVALTTATPAAAQAAPSPWWINVKDHGAQGNGTADDTAAIQQAINAARTAGGGIVILPAGTYRITATLSLTDPAAATFASVSLQGVGPHASTILVDAGTYPNSAAVQALGRDGTKHRFTGTLAKGARSVAVPSALAGELQPGDIVGFEATGPKVFGLAATPIANPRELHRVAQKQGSTIWLDSPLMFDYSTAVDGWRMFAPAGISVRDLGFRRLPGSSLDAYSIRLQKAADVAVERVTMTNAGGGMVVQDVIDGHLSDITIDRLPQVDDIGASFGYGVNVAGGTANLTITGLVGRWCRHVFTTGSDQRGSVFWGGPRDVTVIGGIGEGGPGSKAIWDTHEFGKNISFVGCLARGATDGVGQPDTGRFPGFQVRAHDVSIVDCVATNCGGGGVQIEAVADNVTVQGGELAFNGTSGIAGKGTTMRIVDVHIHDNGSSGIGYFQPEATDSIHISGCHIHDNGAAGVPKAAIHHNTTRIRSVAIIGNMIPYSPSQNISCLGLDADTLVLANNVLLGYGQGKLGLWPTTTGGIKSFNTVDP